MTGPATHVTACCGKVPAGDASEHLVHRLLLALHTHPDGVTVDQLLSYLGSVPPEALDRRIADLTYAGLAYGTGRIDLEPLLWRLTDKGRARAAEIRPPNERTSA